MDETYNGYTNWDTWNTHLWLNNDEGTYHELRSICRRKWSGDSAEKDLKELAQTVIPEHEGIDYSAVNWNEIYESETSDD